MAMVVAIVKKAQITKKKIRQTNAFQQKIEQEFSFFYLTDHKYIETYRNVIIACLQWYIDAKNYK